MTPPASSAQRNDAVGTSLAVRCGQAALAFAFASVLISGMLRSDEESFVVSLTDLDTDAVVVSLASVGFPALSRVFAPALDDARAASARIETNPKVKRAGLSHLEPPAIEHGVTSGPVAYSGDTVLPRIYAAYRSLLKLVGVMNPQRSQDDAVRTIVGTASTYNPHRKGRYEGGMETASGESYDAEAWTAAIHIDLRKQFGGIRYGRLYQPVFALVENGDKRAIVKINDVGPLRPGRIIDLNERSMVYFDPYLQRGLIRDVKVTLLPGEDWTPGPIGGFELASFANAQ